MEKRTPNHTYRPYILIALLKYDGSGETKLITDDVYSLDFEHFIQLLGLIKSMSYESV